MLKWWRYSTLAWVVALLTASVVACAQDTQPLREQTPPVTSPAATESPALTPQPPPTADPTIALTATTSPTPANTPAPAEAAPQAVSVPPSETPPAGGADEVERLGEGAFEYVRRLVEDLGSRDSATGEELAAAEYLVERFEELGYPAALQEFTVETLTSHVVIQGQDGQEMEPVVSYPLNHSAAGDVTGELVFVELAEPDDIPEGGLAGKVALIERGVITFRSKVERVAEAGAAGAVIFNNQPRRFRGTLGGTSAIPALSISGDDGARIRKLMADGATDARVVVESAESPSRNVIAEMPGQGGGVVVIGGHYDTVPESPGANDNASGTGVILTIAEELSGRALPFTLRVTAFGSEETGLHGSRHYVASLTPEERQEIRVMVNLDVVGSGASLRVVGDPWLTEHVSATAEREGITLSVSRGLRGGSSDHAPFRDAGVPILFFYADDLSMIHTPDDTLEFVSPALLGETTFLVLDLLESLDKLADEAK